MVIYFQGCLAFLCLTEHINLLSLIPSLQSLYLHSQHRQNKKKGLRLGQRFLGGESSEFRPPKNTTSIGGEGSLS